MDQHINNNSFETANSTFSVWNLRQQVMSPEAVNDTVIPIKLLGVNNFNSWLQDLTDHVSEINPIWGDYVETGNIHSITQEFNLTTDTVNSIISTLDKALRRLIVKSISPEVKIKVDEYYQNKFRTRNSLELLSYLEDLYGKKCVQHIAPVYFEMNSIHSKSLEEKTIWTRKLVKSMFDLDQLDDEIPDPTMKNTVTEYVRKLQDSAAAMVLMGITPDMKERFFDLFGQQDTVTFKEVYSMIKNSRSSASDVTATPLVAKKKWYGNKQKHLCKTGHYNVTDSISNAQVASVWMATEFQGLCYNSSTLSSPSLTSEDKSIWVLDTGSSTHISCNRESFSNFRPSTNNGTISGVGVAVKIRGYGDVMVGELTLCDVAYVPDLPINLISIRQASKKSGCSFSFDETGAYVLSANNKLTKIGSLYKKLYVLDQSLSKIEETQMSFVAISDPLLTSDVKPVSTAIRWHARFGHPGLDRYNTVARQFSLPRIVPEQVSVCPTCALAKGVMRKGKPSDTKLTCPLQLVQVGLCGGFRYKEFKDNKYFMTIRDAFTRYYVVIHLKDKKDAPVQLINWIKKTEKYFASRGGYRVGSLCTNNGGEFRNKLLHDFFIEQGITHELTIPYDSFQNGGIERGHRTIEETTRCLLISGRVPPSLWSEAVSCAVYLINRIPVTSRQNKIPVAEWYQMKLPLDGFSHLRTFGCAAFATIPHQLGDGKFSPATINGVMVGYDSEQKGYRIFHPESGNVFVSNQVTFDESSFPLEGLDVNVDAHKIATGTLNGSPSSSSSASTFTGGTLSSVFLTDFSHSHPPSSPNKGTSKGYI
ncbi:Tkp5 protein [Vanderwaltozyma polyspora DSM 70294]|uniref:Tkp5 protein n=1 Tax=Vanderwaltozyma polyspora (strain ATCC 22028 / DSM 70294 / BCRC 21397 / CBS 2163 / NBRC 10782 / NRRL Y-8283 / UCD 57-17) TaxID=436907 RepID=A7TE15_VANPO|nr:Tkp5 protein [Vanderwaltozyma polyspora DSM 70294]EDO19635.1 Tkp5 protein [Vanderwaltozyma polyspora DSM 70294]